MGTELRCGEQTSRKRLELGLRVQAWWVALLAASCSVDSRQPTTGLGYAQVACEQTGSCEDGGMTPTLPGESGSGMDASSGQPVVDACTASSECDSGFCVDGVCCDSACDGVCEQCSTAGQCTVVPEDDPACPVIDCPASNECQSYPEALSDDRCLGLGECKSSADCPPSPTASGQLCADPAVTFETRCDGAGNCRDARFESGRGCSGAAECLSGFCVDGVCCQEACAGECEVCSAPNGVCASPDPTSPDAACGEQGRTCVGRGLCLLPLGIECTTGAECGSGNCMPATGGARSVCCGQACGGGQLCTGDGECIAPTADLGTGCQSGADCALGNCVDGVCCDSACGGTCERCNAPGQAGSCVADAPDVACDPQNAQRRCLNRGDCRLPAGLDCQNNSDCGTGRCEIAVGGGRVCCEETCPAGLEACTRGVTGGVCQAIPRENGTQCTANGQCGSNNCQQDRCCQAGCDGSCEVCSNAGNCEVPPVGAERCAAINCPAQNTDCRTFSAIGNLCEALGDCKEAADCLFVNRAQGTSCNLANGQAGQCDGSGSCAAIPVRCGDGILAGSETCDDGNTSNTDNCTNACQLPSCGDGFVQPGRGETCDDGARVNGDGCSVACLFGRAPTGGVVAPQHQCMLRSDGAVVCWGDNFSGQLGQGFAGTDRLGPVVVPNLSNVQQLAAEALGTCGVLRNGSVACWGGNFGTGAASVSGLNNVRQVAGSLQQFCAVLGTGAVTCFDAVGTLTPVSGLSNVRQLAGGAGHFCAVRDDNTVWCWGSNDFGQLGTGVLGDPINTPGPATVFSNVAEVALGLAATCARSRAGGVSCVGGRLPGVGNFSNTAPVSVPGWETATKIVAGNGHLCAMLSNDTVQCVGVSPAAGIRPADGGPGTIFLPSGKIDIGACPNGACVLLSDSSVHCWGGNFAGQLGSPGPDSTAPVRVPVPAP